MYFSFVSARAVWAFDRYRCSRPRSRPRLSRISLRSRAAAAARRNPPPHRGATRRSLRFRSRRIPSQSQSLPEDDRYRGSWFFSQLAAVDPCRVDQRLFEFGESFTTLSLPRFIPDVTGMAGVLQPYCIDLHEPHAWASPSFGGAGLTVEAPTVATWGERRRQPSPSPGKRHRVAAAIFSVGTDVGVFSSANGGRTWRAAGSMLPRADDRGPRVSGRVELALRCRLRPRDVHADPALTRAKGHGAGAIVSVFF